MNPEDLAGGDFPPSMQSDLDERQAALGNVVKAHTNGDIDDDQRRALEDQIVPGLQYLQGRKQSAFENSLKMQENMATRAHAHQTALDMQGRVGRAQAFHDSLTHVVNPFDPEQTQTGYVNEKGNFEPIDFSVGQDKKEEEPLDFFPATQGMEIGQNGTSPNSHTMNINIGDQQSRATFDPSGRGWRQTGQQRFNNATGRWEDMEAGSAMGGTQAPAAAGGPHGQVSESEIKTLAAQAQVAARSLGLQPGTQAFNNAAGHAFNNLMQGRQQQKEREFMRSERERSVADEHRRQETAKASEAKEKAEKHEEDAINTAYHHHLGAINTEVAKSAAAEAKASQIGATDEEKAHAEKLKRPYYESQEAMEAEAMARARRQRSMVKGKPEEKKVTPESGGKGGPPPKSVVDFTTRQQQRVDQPAPEPAPAAQPAPQPAPKQDQGRPLFITRQDEDQPVRSVFSDIASAGGEAASRAAESIAEAGGESQARAQGIANTIGGYARGTALNAKDKAVRAWRRLVGYNPKK